MFSTVTMLDMNISQFLKSLGLDHLRDIFEREQVSGSAARQDACACSSDTQGPEVWIFPRLPWTCWPTWATRS